MAGNSTSINEVVDPAAIEQFNQLKISGKELRTELISLLETAIKLNATLGSSTPANFAKNLKATTDAANQLIITNNKIEQSEIKKQAKKEEIVNKYLISLSKQAAAEDKRRAQQEANDAKEIQQAETKAAKLQAIADRKANTQFPQGQSYAAFETVDDSPAVRYEPIITGQENMTSASTQATAALNAETAAMATQAEGVEVLSAEYRANIELLLELQAERAANTVELKELTAVDAASGERLVFLTAEQLRLKTAIQQTNLTLSQQTKQMLAEDTSTAQQQSRLDELRISYNNLSLAEKENVEIGGVWLAEITLLDEAVKNNAASLGVHNKEVGNYGIATQFADKISAQFIRQLVRMTAQFLLIGVIFGAAQWLFEWVRNLDMFTGRLDQATQNLKALNEVQKDVASQAGDIAGKFRILSDAVKDLSLSYEDRLRAATELKKLFPEELEHSTAQAIANGKESASLDKLTDSVVKLAKAKAAASQIEKTEGEIIALQIQRDKENAAKSDVIDKNRTQSKKNFTDALQYEAKLQGKAALTQKEVADLYNEFLNKQTDNVEKNAKKRADIANKDIADQIAVKEKTIKYLEQYGGLQPEAESLESKPAKTPKTKDTANTELFEYYRLQLEEKKKQAKLILDNDEQSFDVRRAALQVYLKVSEDLVKNAKQTALADKNITNQKRKNIELQFHNDLLDAQREALDESEKLNKEEAEKQKKNLAEIIEASKESEQEQLETLDNGSKIALRGLNKAKDDKENALSLQRAEGKISERKYNEDLLAINDQYNIDRIAQEIATQQAILAIKQGNTDATYLRAKLTPGTTAEQLAKIKSDRDKSAQPTKDKIADLNVDLGNAVSKQNIDSTKSSTKDSDQDKKTIEQQALDFTIAAIDTVDKLRQTAYENEIKRLENQGKIIDENAQIAKDAVNRGLDTERNKARELSIIDAQTASAHEALQQKENQLKRKEAQSDKEAAIAKLVAQGALAVVTALTAPPGVAQVLAAITAATVAVELAKAIATPLPQFAKGGITPGGKVIVGEKGIEHARLPSGHEFYTPGVATIMDLPKGTKITPHHMLPEMPQWTSNRTDNSDVVAAVDRLYRKEQPKQGSQRLSGWVTAQRQADAWNRYTGQYFK